MREMEPWRLRVGSEFGGDFSCSEAFFGCSEEALTFEMHFKGGWEHTGPLASASRVPIQFAPKGYRWPWNPLFLARASGECTMDNAAHMEELSGDWRHGVWQFTLDEVRRERIGLRGWLGHWLNRCRRLVLWRRYY